MQIKLIAAGCLAAIWVVLNCLAAVGQEATEGGQSFQSIVGEWVRPDGGYLVKVGSIQEDGTAEVEYFNPGRINVAEAGISFWKGYIRLFIELQDKGYPGSTYTLYYYKEKDALAGFYYQAVTKQTYEVIFIRKSKL